MRDYVKITSVEQNRDLALATNLSYITAGCPKNITNNTRMLAMSEQSLYEFQLRSATSLSGTMLMTPQNIATGDRCSVESDFTSCRLSNSPQLSDVSSPVNKVNVTNNAFLMASLSGQSLQQSRKATTSQMDVNVDAPRPAVSAKFSSKPDVIVNERLATSMATPWPVFRTPDIEESVEAFTEPAKTMAKQKDLSESNERFQPLKPTLVKNDASVVRQDGTANVLNERSQPLKPALVKKDETRVWQDGIANVPNATSVNEKTTTVAERPRPQPPTSTRQNEKVSETIQATENPSSRVSRTTKSSDDTGEASKTNRLGITLPLDSFTLHETVKQILSNEQEQKAAFALHKTVKRLIDNDAKATGSEANQKNKTENVKVMVIPPRSKQTPGSDGHSASGTQAQQSSVAPAELQLKNKVHKTNSLAPTDDCVNDNNSTEAKPPAVPTNTEEKHKAIRITVQPPGDSKIPEKSAAVKPKKHIRFEMFEDLPSPIDPVHHHTPSPSSSFHMQPDNLPEQELCSVTSDSDLLSPSPIPTDEVLLDSEAMIALRRLFPMIDGLVKVTLVPPRRQSHKNLRQNVEEESDHELSSTSDVDEEEEPRERHRLKDSQSMVGKAGKEVEKPGKPLLQSLSDLDTALLKRSHAGPSHDPSSVEVIDRFTDFPRTQSSGKSKPDDVVSLNESSISSSTALPLDVEEVSSRHMSDVQVSLTKTRTHIVPRVLPPPNSTQVKQLGVQKARVTPALNVANNQATDIDARNDDDVASQPDSLSVSESNISVAGSRQTVHHPAFRSKTGQTRLGTTADDDVDDIVRAATPSITSSLERDIDIRTTTAVSGSVPYLHAATTIVGH